MKKASLWIAVLAIIVLVFFAFRRAPSSANSIKIGADFALTGYEATWGENELHGAELAVDEINASGGVGGRHFALLPEDNRTTPDGSVSAYRKLTGSDSINFLLAGWTDDITPILPLINKDKMLIVTVSAGQPDFAAESPYLFRTWPSDGFTVQNLISKAEQSGWKKLAIVQTVGNYEEGIGGAFEKAAAQAGTPIISRVRVQPGTKDLRTEIIKLKGLNPDAVYIPITGFTLGDFLKQANQLGLRTHFFYVVDFNIPENVSNLSPSDYENVIYPIYKKPNQAFVSSFKQKFGSEPGVAADTSYDAVKMLAAAIQKAGSTDAEAVKQSLLSLKNYQGASGTFDFDATKDRSSADIILMGWNGKKFAPLE